MDNLLKHEMKEMKEDLSEMKGQMTELYQALIGNNVLKDGGLVGRFTLMELKVEKLELRIEEAEKKNTKLEFYQKILWGAAGVTATGILAYLIQIIFNK